MADWSDLDLSSSSITYISALDTLRDRSETNATEVENARQGEVTLDVFTGNVKTELTNAREGSASLVLNLANYIKNGALTTSFNLNNQKAINVANGTLSTDLINLSQATALILGGASPADIDITSIGVGTATAGQRIVSDGTNPIGENNDLLTLDVGALTANQVVGANAGATALEAKDLTTISAGSLTASTSVRVNATGTGLETYDDDLEQAAAALYMYDELG